MIKLLFASAITSLIIGLSIDSRGLVIISFIFIIFTILEVLHNQDERELRDWHKEVKEKQVNDIEDWHAVDYDSWKHLEDEESINNN